MAHIPGKMVNFVNFSNILSHLNLNMLNQIQLDQLDDENPLHQLIDRVERVFHKYDIDVTTCIQRVICITIQNAAENVSKGDGTSAEKIFDGLSR